METCHEREAAAAAEWIHVVRVILHEKTRQSRKNCCQYTPEEEVPFQVKRGVYAVYIVWGERGNEGGWKSSACRRNRVTVFWRPQRSDIVPRGTQSNKFTSNGRQGKNQMMRREECLFKRVEKGIIYCFRFTFFCLLFRVTFWAQFFLHSHLILSPFSRHRYLVNLFRLNRVGKSKQNPFWFPPTMAAAPAPLHCIKWACFADFFFSSFKPTGKNMNKSTVFKVASVQLLAWAVQGEKKGNRTEKERCSGEKSPQTNVRYMCCTCIHNFSLKRAPPTTYHSFISLLLWFSQTLIVYPDRKGGIFLIWREWADNNGGSFTSPLFNLACDGSIDPGKASITALMHAFPILAAILKLPRRAFAFVSDVVVVAVVLKLLPPNWAKDGSVSCCRICPQRTFFWSGFRFALRVSSHFFPIRGRLEWRQKRKNLSIREK